MSIGRKIKPRAIFLNGEDTGLKAYLGRDEAVATLLRVLHRRGRYEVTAEQLAKSHKTRPGRTDFYLEPAW